MLIRNPVTNSDWDRAKSMIREGEGLEVRQGSKTGIAVWIRKRNILRLAKSGSDDD